MLVLVLIEAAPASLRDGLRYERAALAAGQWWRLGTAHLVHLGWAHLAMNLAGLTGLWLLYVERARAGQWALVAAGSALAIGAGLYFYVPDVGWYVGLSGVLHGVWAAAAVAMWPVSRLESLAALALLAGRLLLEWHYGALSAGPGSTLPVVTAAHRFGALGGVCCAAGLRLWRKSL